MCLVIKLARSAIPGHFQFTCHQFMFYRSIIYVHSLPGIPKFILISVHDYNLPSFLLSSGYFTGKRKAESEVLGKYPSSGT